MSYNIKVEDFIDVKFNNSPYDLNDMVHICKRHNNTKREYLFVNKYQAKHFPVNAKSALRLFDCLYEEICKRYTNERILIVGFAETATAIAQRITHNSIKDKRINVVYHLQTTRENVKNNKQYTVIDFSEQHSHATQQKIYYAKDVPEYDLVLFIEDEITTGNTILNFIDEFKKINRNAKYAVASILNWQDETAERTYRYYNIDCICLVKGRIKSELPRICVSEEMVEEYSPLSKYVQTFGYEKNPRTGLSASEFQEYISNRMDNININAEAKDISVLGTEEDMYIAILVADKIGDKATVRATTRSPISTCGENGYLLFNGISLPSAYETQRKTFLYNIDKNKKNIVVVSDSQCFGEFVEFLSGYFRNSFIEYI